MLNSYRENKRRETEQNEIFEGIFDKVFGKKKTPAPQQSGLVKRVGPSSYMFGENFVKNLNLAPNVVLSFDWENSNLYWLFESKFTAENMYIDLNKQVVKSFTGIWEMGPFKGGVFKGEFSGSKFIGEFYGDNADFKAKPTDFLSGSFYAYDKSGILGIPNVISKKTRQKTVNFVAIPEGYVLKIVSVNGVESFIKVVKRLNNKNDSFVYEVTNGYSAGAAPQIKTMPWESLRSIYNTNKIKVTAGKSTNIADILEIPDGIIDLEIIPEGKLTVYPKPSFVNKELTFDLTKLPLGIQSIPTLNSMTPRGSKVSLFIPDFEYAKGFEKVVSNLKNFSFKADLIRIKDAVEHGIVDGYGDFPYLKDLFKGKGTTLKPDYHTKKQFEKEPIIPYGDQKVYDAMSRLNEFMQNFLNRMVVPGTETPDTEAKNYIIERLKEVLGTKNLVAAPEGSNKKEGGTDPSFILPGLKEGNELEIRELARKIIKDNF